MTFTLPISSHSNQENPRLPWRRQVGTEMGIGADLINIYYAIHRRSHPSTKTDHYRSMSWKWHTWQPSWRTWWPAWWGSNAQQEVVLLACSLWGDEGMIRQRNHRRNWETKESTKSKSPITWVIVVHWGERANGRSLGHTYCQPGLYCRYGAGSSGSVCDSNPILSMRRDSSLRVEINYSRKTGV